MIWNGSPELLVIGPLHLRWYGALFATAFICAYRIVRTMVFKDGLTLKQLDYLLWTIMGSVVIGARVGHCLFYQPEIYLHDPVRILKVWEGGLASHGAALGVVIGVYLYTRYIKNLNQLQVYDRIMVPVALAGFFIRLGNFFNSEIIGKPTTMPWGVTFQRIDQVSRHPAQLYESFTYLMIFFFLYRMYWKTDARLKPGTVFGWSLITIFGARFFLEFFKENQEAFENGMFINMGQLLSLPFVAVGIYLIATSKRRQVAVPLGSAVTKKSKG
jgi:prolipoprotein diacylglyceryl transferase